MPNFDLSTTIAEVQRDANPQTISDLIDKYERKIALWKRLATEHAQFPISAMRAEVLIAHVQIIVDELKALQI